MEEAEEGVVGDVVGDIFSILFSAGVRALKNALA
jgi:hypothetical protein